MGCFKISFSSFSITEIPLGKYYLLGNILNVVTDRKLPVADANDNTKVAYFTADVVSYSDYLPFGQVMPNRHGDENQYRYGFNGMEKLDELHNNSGDSYDFGARVYDARLGRWLSRDPFDKKYPDVSPYIFVANNPIMFIDPNGKEVVVPNANDQKLVLRTMTYAFGENHGFAFNDGILKAASPPKDLTPQQELLYNYFVKTLIDANATINVETISANQLYKPIRQTLRGKILPTNITKVEDGDAITLSYGRYKEYKNSYSLAVDMAETESFIVLTQGLLQNGINLNTEEGDKIFDAEHSLLHEFAHAMMNVIMNEMGGKFNDVDFKKMNDEKRVDWAIRYTNTLLKSRNESLETGKGQHKRDEKDLPAKENVEPLSE